MKTCSLVLLLLFFSNSHLLAAPAQNVASVKDTARSNESAETDDDDEKDAEPAGKTPAYFRGVLVEAEFKLEPAKKKSKKTKKQTKSPKRSTKPQTTHPFYTFDEPTPGNRPLAPILTSIDDEKALCAEVVIRFNPGRVPRQLTSECQIENALADGEITLVPSSRLFRCQVQKRLPFKELSILTQPQPEINKKSKKSKKSLKEITILTQPETQTLVCDSNVVFSVDVEGKGPFTFQWRLCDQDIPGATDQTLIISDADPAALGEYSVVVANNHHLIISDTAMLLGEPAPQLSVTDLQTNHLVLLCWPQSCTTFLLEQSLDGVVWLPVKLPVGTFLSDNCVTITQSPNPQLTQSPSLQLSPGSTRQFRLVSSDLLFPKIVLQPASQTNGVGAPIHLSVLVSGTTPFQYQWRLNGSDVPGATSDTLDIPQAQLKDFGTYEVVVLNGVDAILSEAASVVPSGLPSGLSDALLPPDATTNMTATGAILGFNTGFSKADPGEPNHDGRLGGSSAWFTWRPPANGIVTFDTRGSSFDTVLAAYTLDDAGRFYPEASDDDNGGFKTSLIRFNAFTDRTYHIAVDGVRRVDDTSNASEGSIVLHWALEITTDRLPRIVMQPVDAIVQMTNTIVSLDGGGDIGLQRGRAGVGGSTTNALVPLSGSVFLNVLAEVPDCPTCPALTYRWRRDGVDLSDDANVQQTGASTLRILPTDFRSPFFPQPIFPFLAGTYTVKVSNGSRFIESRGAILQFATDTNVVFTEKLDEAYLPPLPPTAALGGVAFVDFNGDGVPAKANEGLSGFTITLTGPMSAVTTTAADGSYVFANLVAGTYLVSAPSDVPAGNDNYHRASPSPLSVTVTTGQTINTNHFRYDLVIGFAGGGAGGKTTKPSLNALLSVPKLQTFVPLSSGTIIANPASFKNSSPIGVNLACRTNGFIPMFVTNFPLNHLTGPQGSNFLYLDTFGSVDTNGVALDTLSINYRVVTRPPIACNNDAEGFAPWSFIRFAVTNLLSYRAVVYASTNSPLNSVIRVNYTWGSDTTNVTAAASSRLPASLGRRSKLEE